jgi:hypothetical protein
MSGGAQTKRPRQVREMKKKLKEKQRRKQKEKWLKRPRPFVYRPLELGWIRILVLEPSPNLDIPISCRIRIERILSPNYRALSYVWGDPGATRWIRLCGRRLNVTQNLHIALKYLRHGDEEVHIWVDAICIN